MEDDIGMLRSTLIQLEQEIMFLKDDNKSAHSEIANQIASDLISDFTTKHEALACKVQDLESELENEKEALAEITEKCRGQETIPLSANRSGTNFYGVKGGPPPGMTTEQVQEFKKQGLQITALQSKAKDLEVRLVEADNAIKRGQDRAKEMEVDETEHVKELYQYFDAVNNTLSEKIANQRVEMEKMAGDTPQPINYDPFNYGDAYEGNIVDFQARKRILEIRLLMAGLTTTLTRMQDAIKVSPSIDLGYKVVRLDELLHATGFEEAVNKGEVSTGEALHVTQAKDINPPEMPFPRKVIFEGSQEQESTWTIINSIMQTMYRLETEIGELQKTSPSQDLTRTNIKDLEELTATVNRLKETKVDATTVRNMLEDKDYHHEPTPRRDTPPPQALKRPYTPRRDTNEKLNGALEHIHKYLFTLSRRIKTLESGSKSPPPAAIEKGFPPRCLTCDRTFDRPAYKQPFVQVPRAEPFSPYSHPRLDSFKHPPRLRSLLNRAYKFHMENLFVDLYQIPRPCGSGYATTWPRSVQMSSITAESSVELPILTDDVLVRGRDGQWYKGQRN